MSCKYEKAALKKSNQTNPPKKLHYVKNSQLDSYVVAGIDGDIPTDFFDIRRSWDSTVI